MKIEWKSGLLIEYEGTKIIFDPWPKRFECEAIFITHAHLDHAAAFRSSYLLKFSSEETMNLILLNGIKVRGWRPIKEKEKFKIDDIEITPHSSGHVLGSYEFEIATPDGTALFTGDLNTRRSRMIKPAEPVKCDVLILDSTFGSPKFVFPPDEDVAEDMINWVKNSLKEGKIPILKADSLGNAQEIIRIFNRYTNIPVISHWKVSRINKVYEAYGHKMKYIDMKSEETHDLISRKSAVIVAPKQFKAAHNPNFKSAMVSGWAMELRGNSFPLSDHADFPSLMNFVSECDPKIVLTYHGSGFNSILAKYIEKNLGIKSYPVDLITTSFLTK